ncbi:hypothetical protein BSLG_005545 [Batrachochytrium salamandrivorans]|nr:hypothetical protein BSLG_005545 [Batrachochytrium salamandrivorans]
MDMIDSLPESPKPLTDVQIRFFVTVLQQMTPRDQLAGPLLVSNTDCINRALQPTKANSALTLSGSRRPPALAGLPALLDLPQFRPKTPVDDRSCLQTGRVGGTPAVSERTLHSTWRRAPSYWRTKKTTSNQSPLLLDRTPLESGFTAFGRPYRHHDLFLQAMAPPHRISP